MQKRLSGLFCTSKVMLGLEAVGHKHHNPICRSISGQPLSLAGKTQIAKLSVRRRMFPCMQASRKYICKQSSISGCMQRGGGADCTPVKRCLYCSLRCCTVHQPSLRVLAGLARAVPWVEAPYCQKRAHSLISLAFQLLVHPCTALDLVSLSLPSGVLFLVSLTVLVHYRSEQHD